MFIRLAETWKQRRTAKEQVIEHLVCLSKEAEMKKNLKSTKNYFKLNIGLSSICRPWYYLIFV